MKPTGKTRSNAPHVNYGLQTGLIIGAMIGLAVAFALTFLPG